MSLREPTSKGLWGRGGTAMWKGRLQRIGRVAVVNPPPLGLEGESVLWGKGMHVLQDGDMGLREQVGERRQEEVWGNPEVERGQRD